MSIQTSSANVDATADRGPVASNPAPTSAPEAASDWRRMTLEELMLREPHAVSTGASIRTVQALMHRSGVGHIPVTQRGQPVGMITARDIALSFPVPLTILGHRELQRLLDLPVAMIMSMPPIVLHPLDTVDVALRRMAGERVGAVMVTDPTDGQLVGLVMRSALSSLIANRAA